jgi:hypothetical protein
MAVDEAALVFSCSTRNHLHKRHECMGRAEVVPPACDMSREPIMYHVEMICEGTVEHVH